MSTQRSVTLRADLPDLVRHRLLAGHVRCRAPVPLWTTLVIMATPRCPSLDRLVYQQESENGRALDGLTNILTHPIFTLVKGYQLIWMLPTQGFGQLEARTELLVHSQRKTANHPSIHHSANEGNLNGPQKQNPAA